jgi:hypothetical protein
MGKMNRSNLTDTLFGHTFIRRIEFTIEPSDGVCALTLELSRTAEYGTDMVCAEFVGVTGLSIHNIGGGISQFLLLIVEDISDEGMERINYRVHEAERNSISFTCRSINVNGISRKNDALNAGP